MKTMKAACLALASVVASSLWGEGPYTVTLDASGGSVSGKASVSFQVEVGKNTCQAGANRTVTRTGYTLYGWYAGGYIVFDSLGYAANGAYWNGSYLPKVSSATWNYAGNVTAYARWNPNKYTVTFNANGGTIGNAEYSSVTVEYENNTMQAGAAGTKATRAGYTLAGWYDKDGNVIFDAQGRAANGKYWNGSYVKDTSSATWKYAGSVTAYARWTANPRKYTLTFHGGGKTIGDVTVEYGKNTNQAAAPESVTRTGYTLAGWYDKDGNILFDAIGYAADGKYWNGSYVKGSSSASWKYAGNVTAYAHWTPNRYAVTFSDNGGNLVDSSYGGTVTVEFGTNTMQAAATGMHVVRSGHTLAGWYDKDGNIIFDARGYAVNGKYWDGSYSPGISAATWKYAGGVTAYARWIGNGYSAITFDAYGGTIGDPAYVAIVVPYGKNTMQAGAAGTKATRSGYTLAGWYDAKTGGNMIFNAKGYAANGTYWNGSYSPGVSSATWKSSVGHVTAYARWTRTANSNAAAPARKVSRAVGPKDDGLFAPGELVGTFADGEGMFALKLDEGLETAYLVTWTADGGITRECEAAVADDALVLMTEAGEVYRLAWEGGSLVAARVE